MPLCKAVVITWAVIVIVSIVFLLIAAHRATLAPPGAEW
jgi:hypothetical protein